MHKSAVAGCTLVLILILLVPGVSFAQAVANANIHGAVSDPSGAAIAGASVKATQVNMGQVRETVTGTDGSYELPNLPLGPYKLEVSAGSFSNYVQTGIELHVADNVLMNVTMQIGAINQQVQVAASAVMVATQETSISEVVDQRRIVDLPLNGRQATDLILLSGGSGVAPTVASGSRSIASTHDYVSADPVSISGGQENGNNYLLDGGDNNDSHSNVNLPFPFPDALQEFSVQTSGVSARYGLHPYAVVNAVTKSGTNKLHGSLFEFVRNGDFNARNFFAATQDTLRRNQFGGTLGGPILKDKLFVFGGYQGTRTRTAPPQTISFVNTAASLSGDFSTLESAACQSSHKAVTLIDPSNGAPFPNNFISPTRFSAPALGLAKLIPVSSDPCGQFTYAIPNPNNENQGVTRMDWLQSSRNTVYGRYFIADYDNPPFYTNNILTTTRSGVEERSQSVTLADQYSGSTFVNAFHATYTRLITNRAVSQEMPNVNELGANMFQSYPHFVDLSVTNYFSIGGGSNAPATFARNQWQLADDVDLIRGSHHIVFGVEALRFQMDEVNISLGNGEWTFNGSLSNNALTDFMLGVPSKLANGNPLQVGLREKYWGAYVQDDIQVTHGLDVHLGVRWEPSLPEHDVYGRGAFFSLPAFQAGQVSSIYPNAPAGLLFHGDPGIPAAYANTNYLGFAPRVGFAWDPTAKGTQSLRGSYGVFFDNPETYTERDWGLEAPWGSSVSLIDPAGGMANPYQGYPGGDPFPAPYPPSKSSTFPASGLYISNPLNLHHMYEQQWDLAYQRQFGGNWLVSASYLGSEATHLRTANEANPAVYIPGASTVANTQTRRMLTLLNPKEGPYYSTITTLNDGMTANYNALRLSAQHRFSHNFTWLSVYTWSHAMQNSEPIANRNCEGCNYYQNPYNRNADTAVSDSDLRQNWVNSLVFQAPKWKNRALDQTLGHWQLGTLINAHTGFPFYPLTGVDNSLTGVNEDRPNVVGNPYVRNLNTLVWINAASFAANPLGTFGNAGWNSLRAPGFFDMDANLSRTMPLRERAQLELRFEFFDLLNNPDFNAPVSTLSSASFGKIQAAGQNRILQFALKLGF